MDSVSNSSPNKTIASDPFPLSLSTKNALALSLSLSLQSSNSSMKSSRVPYWRLFLLLFVLPSLVSSLNSDETLLLSFKYSILDDLLNVVSNWDYDNESPCSWNDVTCTGFPDRILTLTSISRVVASSASSSLAPASSAPSPLTSSSSPTSATSTSPPTSSMAPSPPLSPPPPSSGSSLSPPTRSPTSTQDLPAGDLAELQVLNLADLHVELLRWN